MTLPIKTPKMSCRFEAFVRYESLLFEYLRLSVLVIGFQSGMDSKTVRPSGEIVTTVIMLGSSLFCSQPGGPPGIVNSKPCESERVMQMFPMALANMQVPGRY